MGPTANMLARCHPLQDLWSCPLVITGLMRVASNRFFLGNQKCWTSQTSIFPLFTKHIQERSDVFSKNRSNIIIQYGCWTKNSGTSIPKWMVNIMENPIQMNDLVFFLYFWKHPYGHNYSTLSLIPKIYTALPMPRSLSATQGAWIGTSLNLGRDEDTPGRWGDFGHLKSDFS